MAVGSRQRPSRLLALVLCLASASLRAQEPSPPARAATELDAAAAFERARIYYESAQYTECVQAFRQLLERAERLGARERSSARSYLAACQIALGKPEAAREQFRQAILEDRQLEPPDPVIFPQAVIDTFLQVRSGLMAALQRQQEEELQRSRREAEAQRRREQLERQRVRELERLASMETLVRKNERWMAWVPFGLGQFHNDDTTLGWIFLGTESALAVTAITATSIELGLHSQAQESGAALDPVDLSQKVDAARRVGTVAWLALLGVATAGIVEANLSYRAELPAGQRRRTLPESVRPAPSAEIGLRAVPVVSVGWVGVSGQF